MPRSTSPASPPPSDAAPYEVDVLDGFYRLHAAIYDSTRPLLLFGRRAAVHALGLRHGERVLDVGCGTGYSLEPLHARGARVVGIEPSQPMRRRAQARLERLGLADVVDLDARPYGSHADYERAADALLFSYSLSMIPPFGPVLERAQRDLRPGGRIAVVDFLDAWGPAGFGLRRSHVRLGPERLEALRALFPDHEVTVRWRGLFRYFVFLGRRPARTLLGT